MQDIQAATAEVERLLSGYGEVRLRECGLDALRGLPSYSNPDVPSPFLVHSSEWLRQLLGVVSPETPTSSMNPAQLDINSMLEAPFFPQQGVVLTYQESIHKFWHWMEQAGFALPMGRERQPGGDLGRWMITTLGLGRLDGHHPLQPGAMKNLWQVCGSDHEDSLARFEDAIVCFDHGLWRPAVALLGLAFEELLILAATRLAVTPKHNARERLEAFRKKVEGHKVSDERTAALNALNVANAIREARNNAAHKASGTWTATEVDELLADGMRAYPKIATYVLSA